MGTLVLAGATSGSSTLTPVDAVTAVITLPGATATLATLGANTFVGNQAITGTLSASGAATLSSTLGVTTSVDITGSNGARSLLIKTGAIQSFYDSTNTEQARIQATGSGMSITANTGGGSLAIAGNTAITGTLVTSGQASVVADISIGYPKSLAVTAGASVAAIVSKTVTYNYPNHSMWNAADANDNLWIYFIEGSGGTVRGGVDYNRAGNLVRYSTTSDATLKNLIGDAPQANSLSILSNTRLREYSWKSDETNKPQIGVIAQELVDVFPGAVSVGGDLAGVDEEGNPTTKYHPWSVDKTAYQFHLVAGWQSHEAKIAALEARLAALEAK